MLDEIVEKINRAYKDFESLLFIVSTEDELNLLLNGMRQINSVLKELSKYEEET